VSFLEFSLFLFECSKVYSKLKAEWDALEPKPCSTPKYEEHIAQYPFGATYISKNNWEDYISFLFQNLHPDFNN
jgi:hypothetical protein